MRILYGVFGYGRGHATRALGVLPGLVARHDVLLLAAGDAYDALSERYQVVRAPSVGYVYGKRGRHSLWRTLRENAAPLASALWGTGEARRLRGVVEKFAPDVAISDAEPFTHRLAERLRIPRVGFDHFGLLAHAELELPWSSRAHLARDTFLYHAIMGRPERVVVSSFFPIETKRPEVRAVGPLLRPEVDLVRAEDRGHLLVYFNRVSAQLRRAQLDALSRLGIPVKIYGPLEEKRGTLEFVKTDGRRFLEDLATARAVLSTAGNQLVGECIHFGKPLLVVPENTLEQRINASGVERLGIGQVASLATLDTEVLANFLESSESFAARLEAVRRSPLPDARVVLEETLADLRRVSPGASFGRFGYA